MSVVQSLSPTRMVWGPAHLLVVEAALAEAAHSKGSVQLLAVEAAYATAEAVVPSRHCLRFLL